MNDLDVAGLLLRRATPRDLDLAALVALRDGAARWMQANGIAQWKPGELGIDHFRHRMAVGEVWLAESTAGRATGRGTGAAVGAWELWWDDEPAWGPQPPVAGYVHRLMTDRATAPAGLGRALLGAAERRIAEAGRTLARLDCVSTNPRLRSYYEAAGYTVVGEQPFKQGGKVSSYGVTLMQKRLPGSRAPDLCRSPTAGTRWRRRRWTTRRNHPSHGSGPRSRHR